VLNRLWYSAERPWEWSCLNAFVNTFHISSYFNLFLNFTLGQITYPKGFLPIWGSRMKFSVTFVYKQDIVRVPTRYWKYRKIVELWNWFSRPWRSTEFGQNVHKVLKKYGKFNSKINHEHFEPNYLWWQD